MFIGNFAPDGWHLCDGSLLQVNQNQALYSLIGNAYGGQASSTFALPDLRGRMPLGYGAGPGLTPRNLGNKVGVETVTLITSQLPQHVHSLQTPQVTVAPGTGGSASLYVSDGTADTVTATAGVALATVNDGSRTPALYPTFSASGTPNTKLNSASIQNVTAPPPQVSVNIGAATNVSGGSLPHENMSPALCVNFIICTAGIYPTRP